MKTQLVQLSFLVPLLFSLSFHPSIAQNTSPESYATLEELYISNLKIPREALQNRSNGLVILSVKIAEPGVPDSVFIVQEAADYFNQEVMRVTELAFANWTTEYLEGKPTDGEYLIVASFSIAMGSSPGPTPEQEIERFLKKGKLEKALDVLNGQISQSPYHSYWYHQRSKIHRELGKVEDAQRDFMTFKQLEKTVLVAAEIKAFGVRR